MKRQSLVIALLLCSAFSLQAQNPELKALAEEDQEVQKEKPAKEITRSDQDRGRLVCGKELVSMSPDNYLLAHYLSKESFEGGYAPARYLVAASIDRYMSMTEGRQKYGTNRITNQKTGKDEWVPIDRATPDSERAKYGIPPLAELLKQFPEQSSSKYSPTKRSRR